MLFSTTWNELRKIKSLQPFLDLCFPGFSRLVEKPKSHFLMNPGGHRSQIIWKRHFWSLFDHNTHWKKIFFEKLKKKSFFHNRPPADYFEFFSIGRRPIRILKVMCLKKWKTLKLFFLKAFMQNLDWQMCETCLWRAIGWKYILE